MPTYNPKYSYSDTATQERSVIPEFDLVSPNEVPFLKLISGGTDDQPSLNSLSEPCEATKFEWLENSDPILTTTITASAASGDTGITVASGYVGNVVEGSILLIGSEQLLVGATTGANPVPVTRAWGGTTAASAAADATVTVIGMAHKEGADAPFDFYQYPSAPYNYVQEFARTIALSEIEQAIQRYGVDDALEFETANKMRQLAILAERQCFYGKRVQGTSSVPSAFGGLDVFIPSGNKVDGSSNALTTAMVGNALQNVFSAVGSAGMPDTIIVNGWLKRKITSLFSSIPATVGTTASAYNVRDAGELRGGVKVDKIITDFGTLDVVLDNWAQADRVYFVKRDKLGFGPLRDKSFKRQMLAKTGTADRWMISGTYVLQVRAANCHAMIHTLSTST